MIRVCRFAIIRPLMTERASAGKIGLLGVSGAGKTTLFSSLTDIDYSRAVAASGRTISGSVRVEDPRLLRMHEVEGSHKKLVAPLLEVMDGPAIPLSPDEKRDLPNALPHFRECDGYLVVLKAYEGADPKAQLDSIRNELFLADVESMERRIEKLRGEVKRSLPNREELKKELATFERMSEAIMGGDTNVLQDLSPEDEEKLRGYQFYSRKPIIPMVNLSEMELGKETGELAACIKLEKELLEMEGEERESFMGDYGLEKLTLPDLAVSLYGRMGYQTFVTVGDKDVTAWHLRKGATAFEAAGRIHTDLQKGFINCEAVSFGEWEGHKDYHEARARGKFRVEGREGLMQDFDVINVKFNV